MCCSCTSKQEAPTIFQVLVPSTQPELYVNLAVRCDYSSPAARVLRRPRRAPRLLVSGRTRSTSTSPCASTTRLRLHALYVDLAVRRDYSSPVARALRQPRRAPRVLVSTLPAAAIYLDYAARPGASARRSSRRSSSTTPGSSSTTSPPPRVRVPRHVARLVAPLVVDYFGLVVDYFTSAARPGASARRVSRHVARRGVRRRLLRAPQLPLAATLALLQPRCAS
jgi:hypothetical protein